MPNPNESINLRTPEAQSPEAVSKLENDRLQSDWLVLNELKIDLQNYLEPNNIIRPEVKNSSFFRIINLSYNYQDLFCSNLDQSVLDIPKNVVLSTKDSEKHISALQNADLYFSIVKIIKDQTEELREMLKIDFYVRVPFDY